MLDSELPGGDGPATTTVTGAADGVATSSDGAAATAPAGVPVRPRRRAASRPAGPPQPVVDDDRPVNAGGHPAPPPQPAPGPDGQADSGSGPTANDAAGTSGVEAPAKPVRTRRRPTTPAKASLGPEADLAGTPAPVAVAPEIVSGVADPAAPGVEPDPAEAPRARRRRRTAGDASEPAATSASRDSETAAEPLTAAVPPVVPAPPPVVTFRAPVVAFVPPVEPVEEPPKRRRRTRAVAADVEEALEPQVAVASPAGESVPEDLPAGEEPTDPDDEDGRPGRRRRRGRRGRGKGPTDSLDPSTEVTSSATDEDEPAALTGELAAEQESAVGAEEAGGTRRRRRRRRRGGAGDGEAEPGPDDPPDTVVRVREGRGSEPRATQGRDADEVRGVRGSTRLEARRQRRREGRDSGRRRPSLISESEFLARREAVERVMVVRESRERTQVAVLEDGVLVEHYVTRATAASYVGNVYLGRVQNVLPSMEAAFVDIGKGRNAVLYAGEVNYDASSLEGRPQRIEQALKPGQSVLVQVTKDPIGSKGARLTSQVSLPGRFLVFVPEGTMAGISRKLPDTERSRLKSLLKRILPEGAGVIVRTAAEGASEAELTRDVARLTAHWENITSRADAANPPALLYSEPDLVVRVFRDIFNEDFTSVIVQGEEEWDTIEAYVDQVAPDLRDRVTRWAEDRDVFSAYRVDEQLAKALERKVWLPSGGSLVFDRTEAMVVVDVNTGKFTGSGGNLEETVTRNNIEAAEEIVRQLRLRDLGGIIVIDFIDMVLESNRDLVLRRLLECLGRDRTKHQVAEVTSLGLVQMTRKRVGQGLVEAFSEPCPECGGRGIRVTVDPFSPVVSARRQGRGVPTPLDVAHAQVASPAAGPVLADAVLASAAVSEPTLTDLETSQPVPVEPITPTPVPGEPITPAPVPVEPIPAPEPGPTEPIPAPEPGPTEPSPEPPTPSVEAVPARRPRARRTPSRKVADEALAGEPANVSARL